MIIGRSSSLYRSYMVEVNGNDYYVDSIVMYDFNGIVCQTSAMSFLLAATHKNTLLLSRERTIRLQPCVPSSGRTLLQLLALVSSAESTSSKQPINHAALVSVVVRSSDKEGDQTIVALG